MKFTIKKIKDGLVDVSFDIDNKIQTIAGLDVENTESLTQQLIDYGTAYEVGKAQEVIVPSKEVTSMVNTVVDVDALLAQREADRLAAEEAARIAALPVEIVEAPVETPVETVVDIPVDVAPVIEAVADTPVTPIDVPVDTVTDTVDVITPVADVVAEAPVADVSASVDATVVSA